MWYQTWADADVEERTATRTTWATTGGMLLNGDPLNHSRGPLQVTAKALTFLQWHPSAPDRWIITMDGKGNATQWVDLNKGGCVRFQILDKAMRDAQVIMWKRASAHACGTDLRRIFRQWNQPSELFGAFARKGLPTRPKLWKQFW